MSDFGASILQHYENAWRRPASVVPFARGPIHELEAGFAVLRFAPTEGRNMWTYATQSMSRISDERPLELHLFSRVRADEELAELLTAAAHYHCTGNPLWLHHSVNFGRPWLPGSACDHGFISLPYLDGPPLEWATILGKEVRFLWLLPIAEPELAYIRECGVNAFERCFEESRVDYANAQRNSVNCR